MAKLSEILRERGYSYQQSSETLEEITDGPKRTLYYGVDPSADSLHVGQLMNFLILRRFVEDGHKVILLLGGGTGMIGDPGGKSAERPLLEADVVRANAQKIGEQVKAILGTEQIEIVNNADWLTELRVIDFLRDVGKHFSVNAMLAKDFIRDRIENKDEGISYTEFSYALLQSYDFYHLHKQHGCDLQLGGSDQWGNIVSGVDFIRRKTGDAVYAMTWPLLINKATGKKFGKSEGGAVWLDPHKTPAFQFYQFWVNSEDDVLEEYLLKLTTLSKVEIAAAMELHKRNPSERHGQKLLARQITTLVHGVVECDKAEEVSRIMFGEDPVSHISVSGKETLLQNAPSYEISVGANVIDVLALCGLSSSKREARQFVENHAIVLNDKPITDGTYSFTESDFFAGIALLRRGKRNVCVLVLK